MPAWANNRASQLRTDEPLALMPDPCNKFDRKAVALRTVQDATLIGYVPRYMAGDVGQLLAQCRPELINVQVEQLNSESNKE